jgi:DNA-binding NarL/FixJ family response regulator
METIIRVLIADDHEIFRVGLAKTIERDKTFSTIAQASNGKEALEMIKSEKPDIAVLDVSMPIMDGLEVGRTVYREGLPTELIFLTMYKDIAYFNAAMDIGVRGYLLKDNASADLLACLRTVLEGNHYISPTMGHLLVERINQSETLSQHVPTLADLSPAERIILKYLADNMTSKEIAENLFVSIRTVENHRVHISRKLKIKGPHRLLKFALENKSAL